MLSRKTENWLEENGLTKDKVIVKVRKITIYRVLCK